MYFLFHLFETWKNKRKFFFNSQSRTPTVKTVKTTQGHLAVIKSRNKAYEVRLDMILQGITKV